MKRASRHGGFTLVELMVTLVVAAILMSIAIPSFQAVSLSSKLRSTANNLSAAALLARSEAIKRNQPTRLCASSNGSTCTGDWKQGWVVLSHDNTVIHREGAAPKGFEVIGTPSSLAFQPDGVGATSARFTVCRVSPSVGSQERIVDISATGRPTVTRTASGTCSS
ncbi:MAG: GspH/FimT family pseudopilin [Pseudomonas sp.]